VVLFGDDLALDFNKVLTSRNNENAQLQLGEKSEKLQDLCTRFPFSICGWR